MSVWQWIAAVFGFDQRRIVLPPEAFNDLITVEPFQTPDPRAANEVTPPTPVDDYEEKP